MGTPPFPCNMQILGGQGEMFGSNSTDMQADKFPLMWMGCWVECLGWADPWMRPPIGFSPKKGYRRVLYVGVQNNKKRIFHKKFRGPLPPPRGSIILVFFVDKNEKSLALPEMERQLNKIPLVPQGFLTPGSAYAWPSARPPREFFWLTCLQN